MDTGSVPHTSSRKANTCARSNNLQVAEGAKRGFAGCRAATLYYGRGDRPTKLICFSPSLPRPLHPSKLRDQKHKNGRYRVAQRAHSGFSIRYYGKIISSINKYSVQFSSVAQLCLTLCDPMDCSTPVHHQLLEFTQTYVYRLGDGIQPSHPLSSPFPPALNLSQHQGLFK